MTGTARPSALPRRVLPPAPAVPDAAPDPVRVPPSITPTPRTPR